MDLRLRPAARAPTFPQAATRFDVEDGEDGHAAGPEQAKAR